MAVARHMARALLLRFRLLLLLLLLVLVLLLPLSLGGAQDGPWVVLSAEPLLARGRARQGARALLLLVRLLLLLLLVLLLLLLLLPVRLRGAQKRPWARPAEPRAPEVLRQLGRQAAQQPA